MRVNDKRLSCRLGNFLARWTRILGNLGNLRSGGFKILGNLSLPPSPDRSGCDLELSSADVSGEGGGQRYQFICGGHTPTRVWEEPIREESLYLPATQSVTELSKTDALLGVDVIPI